MALLKTEVIGRIQRQDRTRRESRLRDFQESLSPSNLRRAFSALPSSASSYTSNYVTLGDPIEFDPQ